MPPSTEQDIELDAALAACARGDRAAMRRLYEQEAARMLGIALRIVRDRGRAEDIVHDACIKIWRRAGSFDPARGEARGWIHAIVRNLALNTVRDGARDVALDDDAGAAVEDAASLAAYQQMTDAFELRDDLGRLGHCLQALDAPRRNSVLLAYVEGCSHGEIAQRLGAPLGTVKAWIRRSLLALKECMA